MKGENRAKKGFGIKDRIKERILEEKKICFKDIIGTPLEELLNTLYLDYTTTFDENTLNNDLQSLFKLKSGACGYFYAVPKSNGPVFF